jgi:predicted nucleic acid-binding protein
VPDFVDTNVFIHYLLGYDPARHQTCEALLFAAEHGRSDLETSDMVIAELVWFLQRPPIRMSPRDIRDHLLPLIGIEGLRLPSKPLLEEAFRIFADAGISFVDAYNLGVMRRRRIDRVFSYDTDFDGLPGITRLEP